MLDNLQHHSLIISQYWRCCQRRYFSPLLGICSFVVPEERKIWWAEQLEQLHDSA